MRNSIKYMKDLFAIMFIFGGLIYLITASLVGCAENSGKVAFWINIFFMIVAAVGCIGSMYYN